MGNLNYTGYSKRVSASWLNAGYIMWLYMPAIYCPWWAKADKPQAYTEKELEDVFINDNAKRTKRMGRNSL